MTINVEFWDLAKFLSGLLVLFVTSWWAFGKLFMYQFNKGLDQRFETQDEARQVGQKRLDERFCELKRDREKEMQQIQRIDRDLLTLRAELPREYVRREDHIRFETVINAKLDAVAAKIDLVAEKQRKD